MTAYERRISDWSSDVCSSDLVETDAAQVEQRPGGGDRLLDRRAHVDFGHAPFHPPRLQLGQVENLVDEAGKTLALPDHDGEEFAAPPWRQAGVEIGSANVRTTVTTAHLVCRFLLEKNIKP